MGHRANTAQVSNGGAVQSPRRWQMGDKGILLDIGRWHMKKGVSRAALDDLDKFFGQMLEAGPGDRGGLAEDRSAWKLQENEFVAWSLG